MSLLDVKYCSIFPISVHNISINGFDEIKDELIKYAYNLKNTDPNGVQKSNYGGWHSALTIIDNSDNILQKLLIRSIQSLPIHKSYLIHVSYWVNINPPKSYNSKHNHPASDLSGVLWLKSPENCGNIVFENPFIFQDFKSINSYTQEYKEANNQYLSYDFTAEEGTMIVFPSHLQHKVRENQSNEDRISVSFNLSLTQDKRV